MTFDKQKYDNNYCVEHYDRLAIRVNKGGKQEIADFAKVRGMSLNEFVNKAIVEKMERESAGN